ncbi:class I adenylate-forming enzyme family protein [Mycolicibacterium conceptionense]|uniref:class I adenylate-forming enzyme family protein n=1 Tax=Mycolicibacterium conceptionense TaxID=451644 RepID=UPI00096D71B6|nr:class I adenylate-forming enzyme family protein [Mycolicibacterium conceptionense]
MTAHFTDDRALPFPTLGAALDHWASVTPEALAITAGERELTYFQFADAVSRCMGWLAHQGVRPGDRVVIVGYNEIAWVVHYMAVLAMGAIIAPANNRLNPSQFADQVELLDAVVVLADDAHSDIVAEVPASKIRTLSDANTVDTAPPFTAPDPSTPALVSFTSGTTGKPKGATLTQRALAEASWAFVRVMGTTGADSTLVVVPMFHNTGFVDQFGHMLLLGGRTDLLRKFHTKDAVTALIARPVTYLAAVPSIHRLIMLADGADRALASMQILLYGGSPMPAPWIDELLASWPQLKLFHGYGMTEYGSAVSFLRPEFAKARGESVGFAVPGTTIRIVGQNDLTDVADGEIGEMWVKGPTLMQGYWRQPELTATKIHDGWLRTGDLARLDDGFYYIEGRVDDVINRGGEKILPAHVEGLLAAIDAVGIGCVFGVPDSILQNRIWAAVEERPGHVFDESTARDLLRTQLPDYAVPERIWVLNSLPRTASGKVDRRAVADHFSSVTAQGIPARE